LLFADDWATVLQIQFDPAIILYVAANGTGQLFINEMAS
jgi:hypothetical protein